MRMHHIGERVAESALIRIEIQFGFAILAEFLCDEIRRLTQL